MNTNKEGQWQEVTTEKRKSTKTIRHRLFILSFTIIGITAVIGVFSIYEFYTVNKASNRLVYAFIPEWEMAERLEQAIREAGYYRVRYSNSGNEEDYALVEERFTIATEALTELEILGEEKNLPVLAREIGPLGNSVHSYIDNVKRFKTLYDEIQAKHSVMEESATQLVSYVSLLTNGESDASDETKLALASTKETLSNFWFYEASKEYSKLEKLNADIRTLVTSVYENPNANPGMRVTLEKFYESGTEFTSTADTFLELHTRLAENEGRVYETSNASLEASVSLSEAAYVGSLAIGVETTENGNFAITIVSIVLVAGIVISGFLSFFVSSSINKTLMNLLSRLRQGAEQVNASSDHLSDSSQLLAESSSEQAASIQETTSSLEEMSAQIKQTDENSEVAERDMHETTEIVNRGLESMQKMKDAMAEIQESSNQTSNIIKTIDDIAFQTNLLALNAAVEAARAGEAGKGFAVVAEEVRHLAQRSAEAAQNTSDLIKKSQSNSERGGVVAEEVANNLEEIHSKTSNVNVLVAEISQASKEQAIGTEQMTSVMSEMDSSIQSNASAAEESASSAEQLSSSATELMNIVGELLELVVANKDEKSFTSGFEPDQPTNFKEKYAPKLPFFGKKNAPQEVPEIITEDEFIF